MNEIKKKKNQIGNAEQKHSLDMTVHFRLLIRIAVSDARDAVLWRLLLLTMLSVSTRHRNPLHPDAEG